jgi:uncharacterized protein
MNHRSTTPVLLVAALLSLCSACGQTGVMLVAGHPPAPGTILQDESTLYSGHSTPSARFTTAALDRAEVRPDGSVHLERLFFASSQGGTLTHGEIEGAPLLWRAAPGGWTVAMEQGAPTQTQAGEIKKLVPPFVTDAIYLAQPVRLGERWNLNADAALALLSRLAGMAIPAQSSNDNPSGWMELSSLADRDGQRCAMLRFEVRFEVKMFDKPLVLKVSGDAVRSLVSFQDLSMEAKAEWAADPGKPATLFGSATFHRRIVGPDQSPAGAMFKHGEEFFLGQGVPKDDAWASEWYQRAARAGDAGAMNRLGEMFVLGLGFPQDEPQAFAWFAKSAEAGNANAMAGLGDLYKRGHGVALDYAKAREWYQKAAEAGNVAAMPLLSMLYQDGRGGPRDSVQALLWLRKGAEGGDGNAMCEIGLLYATGSGVPQDDAQAAAWFRKGAEAGDPDAIEHLGFAYWSGDGVAQDYAQAKQCYQKAAAAGNAAAMYNLGLLYKNGDGVAQDYAQARQWYQKAADAGYPGAVEALAKLNSK